MGQEVLDAFWKSNDRIYNENTLLYHRLARACGLPACAFWLLYTLRSEEAPLTQTQLSEQLSLNCTQENGHDGFDPRPRLVDTHLTHRVRGTSSVIK